MLLRIKPYLDLFRKVKKKKHYTVKKTCQFQAYCSRFQGPKNYRGDDLGWEGLSQARDKKTQHNAFMRPDSGSLKLIDVYNNINET